MSGGFPEPNAGAHPFPPLRRVLTSHHPEDHDGQNVIIMDDQLELPVGRSGGTGMAPVFASLGLPAENAHTVETSQIDAAVRLATPTIVTAGGVNGRIVQMLPGQRFEMHRTSSIDYNIMLSGSVDLITPAGRGVERTTVRAGDVVIQRGTLHAWEAGVDGARWFSVIVAASPVHVGGQNLPDVKLH